MGARAARALGRGILRAAPWLMKFLSFAGTAAMFLVGGGILTHGLHALGGPIESAALAAASVPGIGPVLHGLVPVGANLLVGLLVGALVLAGLALARKVLRLKG